MSLENLSEFKIDKYSQSTQLGVGGFGMVFLFQLRVQYRDAFPELPNEVAVKTFPSKEWFEKEAKILDFVSGPLGQQLHPNIVKIFGQCFLGNRFCIVMEKYDKPLSSLIMSKSILGRALDVSSVRSVLYQLANALVYLHGKNLIHRDIKPENILVQVNGDDIQIALSDLGISRILIATEQSNLTKAGSLKWMAPELKAPKPKYGHPADIFGFGLIAVYVKTGDEPRDGDFTGKKLSCHVYHFYNMI